LKLNSFAEAPHNDYDLVDEPDAWSGMTDDVGMFFNMLYISL